MGVVADLADEVLVMHEGQVIERGDVEQVFVAPEMPYTQELLAAVPRLDQTAVAVAGTPADGPAAADVRDVTIGYGSGRHSFIAVDHVSLTVPAGQTVGLVGESGSGKTTLGKAIARLVGVASGTISVGDHDLAALRGRALRAARAEIGFVFQNPGDSLNPRARVGAIIAEPLQLHTHLDASQRRQRAAELLGRVKLPADAIDRYPHQLSVGSANASRSPERSCCDLGW